MADRPNSPDDPTAFREAISDWQLAARTEVKKASSLPSSVFDAADPMVEARLAETVDAMMQLLHRPSADALRKHASGEHLEQRAEQVAEAELRELPTKIPRGREDDDLEDGVSPEYLHVLIDACTSGEPESRRTARELLAQDFAVPADADLNQIARALSERLRGPDGALGRDDEELNQLDELCRTIAATVVINTTDAQGRQP